jgi:hypothetical protein
MVKKKKITNPTSTPAETISNLQAPPTAASNNITPHIQKSVNTATSYSELIGSMESDGNSKVTNGQYKGTYQMGDMALQDAGLKNPDGSWRNGMSDDKYLNDPAIQTKAFNTYTAKNKKALANSGANTYIGKVFKGIPVTMKGLLAASHLVGATAVSKMLKTGIVPEDGNGTKAIAYLEAGGLAKINL